MPSIQVKDVTYDGGVTITFSDEFIVITDLSLLKREELLVDGEWKPNLELIIKPTET